MDLKRIRKDVRLVLVDVHQERFHVDKTFVESSPYILFTLLYTYIYIYI